MEWNYLFIYYELKLKELKVHWSHEEGPWKLFSTNICYEKPTKWKKNPQKNKVIGGKWKNFFTRDPQKIINISKI